MNIIWSISLPPRPGGFKKKSKAAPDADDHKILEPLKPPSVHALIHLHCLGLVGTLAWSTANILDAKVEAENNIADGLKLEGVGSFKPDSQDVGSKLNLYFKQPNFHFRVMSDLLKGPALNADLVLGSQGFLVGGEAGYDVQKAALTRYSASVGYAQGSTTSAITASNNFSIFAASVYNKVNKETEIGVKAAWDSKSSTAVGMELAAKYKVDPLSFVKVRMHCNAEKSFKRNHPCLLYGSSSC